MNLSNALAVLLFSALMAGCATPPLYDWGDYDTKLYAQYKDAAQKDAFKTSLDEHIQAVELTNEQIAPGLYAELGTLYLQSNDLESARKYYEKELQVWPESKILMETLISVIDERLSSLKATPALGSTNQ